MKAKQKYSFYNDYAEGAHQNILNALIEANLKQDFGYGEDLYCEKAIEKIKTVIGNQNASIHFVSGGTQANLISISSALKPYQSVIAPLSGHIAIHEAGAIENTGHKINTIPTSDGKITVTGIQNVLKEHIDEHMVKPRMVFVSQPTELGTLYSKSELSRISEFCNNNNLYLYLDGARLGSALSSLDNDLSFSELSNMVDMFYIGGTKNGALIGEAIVINNDNLKIDFRYFLKQNGALLAKGRLLGIQFFELFKGNLYFELGKNANTMAAKLSTGIKSQGYSFLTQTSTNQIFPIFPNSVIEKLSELYGFYIWSKVDDNKSAVRLVTSWATQEERIINFLSDLNELK